MKTRTVLSLSMFCLILSFVVGVQISKAQNASAGASQNELGLIGRDSKQEDVVLRSDAIFIGQVLQIGPLSLSAKGEDGYNGSKVTVSQVLKGSVAAQVTVAFKIRHYLSEQPPTSGISYIFFVKKNHAEASDQFTVLKLLPATDANIAKVKALIAAAPAGK